MRLEFVDVLLKSILLAGPAPGDLEAPGSLAQVPLMELAQSLLREPKARRGGRPDAICSHTIPSHMNL